MKITLTTDDGIVVEQWSIDPLWVEVTQNPFGEMREMIECKLPVAFENAGD